MNDKIRCIRCGGRKKLYQVGSAYSYINTGGKEVACPMCLGEGSIKKLECAIKEAANLLKSNSSDDEPLKYEEEFEQTPKKRGRRKKEK